MGKRNRLKERLAATRENKLFVYGIFLGAHQRERYNMTNPQYATVPDFVTTPLFPGGNIVEAVHVPNAQIALTGLTVDMDENKWASLDALEAGYERIKVKTSNGITYMYARKGTGNKHE